MAHLIGALVSFMPHRIIGALLLRARFTQFAKINGLVYFGLVGSKDNHEATRGFTTHAGQIDNFVMHGSIRGREVALVQRTVTHAATAKTKIHAHSWIILSVKHGVAHTPPVLMLSHEHPRLHDEATAIHESGSKHIALEYRVDAKFLVYAKRSAANDFRELATNDFIEQLISNPNYDYEFDSEWVYVYSHSARPTVVELNQLLATGLALVDSYDDDIEKSP